MLPAEETTPTPEWTLVDEFVTRSDRMPRRDELKTFLNKLVFTFSPFFFATYGVIEY